MKKIRKDAGSKVFEVVFLIVVILFLISVFSGVFEQKRNKVCFEKNCFEVELAITNEEHESGLSGREFLEQNKGMLYSFDNEDIHNFWMKGMKFPLDIIWINTYGTIVDKMENADPCNGPICFDIITDKKAKYVLEVNAGTIKNLNLNVGDRAEIKIIKKKS